MLHEMLVYGMLTAMAFIAGTADAVAGGGGLITVPALLWAGITPVQALGTDKLQSAIGELSATLHFFKKGGIHFRFLILPITLTCFGALIGVIVLKTFSMDTLEKIIPWLLLAALLYYLLSKDAPVALGERQDPESTENKNRLLTLSGTIGFYNGFFGPGTGTLWSVGLMRWLKLSIHQATMWTKPLNLAANCAALVLFISIGNIAYLQAIFMGIGSLIGGQVGARLVLKVKPSHLRVIFIILMGASTASMFVKYYV